MAPSATFAKSNALDSRCSPATFRCHTHTPTFLILVATWKLGISRFPRVICCTATSTACRPFRAKLPNGSQRKLGQFSNAANESLEGVIRATFRWRKSAPQFKKEKSCNEQPTSWQHNVPETRWHHRRRYRARAGCSLCRRMRQGKQGAGRRSCQRAARSRGESGPAEFGQQS